MKKLFLIFFFTILTLFSQTIEINSLSFIERQSLIEKIKLSIEREEAIAKAYEQYLLTEYKRAKSLSLLLTSDYLGRSFPKNFSNGDEDFFRNYSLLTDSQSNQYITYRLKPIVNNDNSLRTLYEGDTFRKKTFFYKNKIYIILNKNLAKSIYALIKKQDQDLLDCSDILSKQYCIKVDTTGKFKKHIFIYSDNNKTVANLLMYYLPKNFEKGPILIKDDISVYDEDEFKLIPSGASLYDFKGQKYLKTFNDIRKVN